VMYMRESRRQIPVQPIPFGLGVALAISVLATLYLGLLPDRVLQVSQHSAQALISPQATTPSLAQTPPPAPAQQ